MTETIANFLQVLACYQCVYGKEPCEYLPKDDMALCTHYKWRADEIINKWQSADVIEGEDPDVLIVHDTVYVKRIICKDCKHWSKYMAGLGTCDKLKTDMGEYSYCCYGEVKEEDEREIEREIKALRLGEE